jgi:hypothetical protein
LFFLISSFDIKLLILELCDFSSFFFLRDHPKCRLVKLSWFNSSILWCFFKSIFLSWFHIMGCKLVKLACINSRIFFMLFFKNWFFSQFNNLTLGYWGLRFMIFFRFLSIRLSQSHIPSYVSFKLTVLTYVTIAWIFFLY